ncbi:MAG: DUF2877 domain-containing protein [Chloroflexi bacterium]|nr:MAG: DUF2877 domain-containing protein [Chloroflexota bacterium]
MVLKAELVSPRARDWLLRNTAVRVLSVFDKACNLVDEGGDVVSLTTSELGAGPFAIVLPFSRIFSDFIRLEMSVARVRTGVLVGGLEVDVRFARVWQPVPSWHQLSATAVFPLLYTCLPPSLREGQLDMSGFPLSVQDRVNDAITRLVTGLVAEETAVTLPAVRTLAGLGHGLTPSGDDVLVGVMYGLWACWPTIKAQRWCKMLAETAVTCTNTLSAAWLQAASHGEATPPWHELVNGLITDSKTAVTLALARIQQTGHTSGTDALIGFTHLLRQLHTP